MTSRPIITRWIIPFIVLALAAALFVPASHVRSQSSAPQKIESDDSRVAQSGAWSAQSSAAASGGSYLFNDPNQTDAALTIGFYGSYLEVLYVSGPSLGTLAIEVDGSVLRTVITTDTSTRYLQSARITYLSDEWHVARLYAQEGGVVAIDALVVRLDGPRVPDSEAASDQPVVETLGGPRAAPTNVVINEVDPGNTDAIELYNPTGSAINMTSFSLLTYGFDNALEVNYNFPAFYLFPGAYVTLYESGGTNTSTQLFLGQNIGNWVHGGAGGGAVTLSNAGGTALDFVRWGTATVPPPVGQTFTSSVSTPESPNTLGRNANSDETNSASDWSSQCATLGGPNQRCLVINEVYYGNPDQVELYNGSSVAINLDPYVLQVYDTPNILDINFNLPSFTLQPGAFVVLIEGAGTNTSNTIYMNDTTTIISSGGAVTLLNGATPVDFVQWGSSTTSVPAGTSFAGTAPPTPSIAEGSFARSGHNGYDTDRATEWCGQNNTLYNQNNPCLVINEVDTGDPDWVEIINLSTTNFTLTNWAVYFVDGAGNVDINYVFPAFTLNAGFAVRVHEGAGTNTTSVVYTGTSITDWNDGSAGSVVLTSPFGTYVDFVRWGNSTYQPGAQLLFSGPPLPSAPTSAGGQTLARNSSSADRNITEDWCQGPATPGYRNYGCQGQIALFYAPSSLTTLIDTSTTAPSAPAPDDYYTYNFNVPNGAAGGQMVMGDWDGDGDKTPGIYFTSGPNAGVFYTTNEYGPNAFWTGTWFGLFAGVAGNVPVVGRFNGAFSNDCLGVIDSASFPPFGTAFALYFTCTTTGGNPTKSFQWVSVLLPDSGGFSGTFQFGAGDYNLDGIDTVACRRGEFIAYSNTPPTTQNGEFPLAQYIGTPPGASGANNFVVGDWDNDGFDTFGLYYAAQGRHWFRNDYQFNSGVYGYRDLYLPLGTSASATTWSGY